LALITLTTFLAVLAFTPVSGAATAPSPASKIAVGRISDRVDGGRGACHMANYAPVHANRCHRW